MSGSNRGTNVNADFTQRVALHAEEIPWQASPVAGVSRRMLDRVGGEVARATTLVRYDPASRFSPHVHDGGEEFIVLEGVFQDEHGDYPAGTYVRNPPTSRHRPGSQTGCLILVKLWQFDPADRSPVRIDLDKVGAVPDPARPGVAVTPLFRDGREDVRLEHWQAGAEVPLGDAGGAEYFLLEGGFTEAGERFGRHAWLRLPAGDRSRAEAGPGGAKLWVKTGHLTLDG